MLASKVESFLNSSAVDIENTPPPEGKEDIAEIATALFTDSETDVITVRNEVLTALVVTPTPICVSSPPVVASSAYIPLSLSSSRMLFLISAEIPFFLRNAMRSCMEA